MCEYSAWIWFSIFITTPLAEVTRHLNMDPTWQVLSCRVLHVDSEKEKLGLSLNLLEELEDRTSEEKSARWARRGQVHSCTVSIWRCIRNNRIGTTWLYHRLHEILWAFIGTSDLLALRFGLVLMAFFLSVLLIATYISFSLIRRQRLLVTVNILIHHQHNELSHLACCQGHNI
jgi:hypothetical protein